ncbi:small ribosomal subunit protein mS39 isoform X2 [Canis lupus baileyi]|uniref:pentatricopeptide repeat domain-containing protein 3, mitochondrial isoform X2 n=1 Tax=Canis lupus familiaris TaxID=9615 RepID=UPI0003AE4A67|nr:pentatricopeptide repeat domain-containing protein 3, mitochondrial isoform X2 [Canis lupus familiaris]XP_025309624.1 pentatricopeptide repeat domain-containing protein 3, mitochondrial isoform X2 [Canis lupus dingo]XP_038417474.1 pentatricopeptide repeat domain-containing protein 3, mitochondrial isoform X2 [Canis lupus familiaris]XP_038547437.1 pentatricopeptide repeat domain-containing protein 3, mitochondrial isoform X2 [Canis lupus familiaris]|eukprot:XP_005630532.1 pentatricopeptide repeat domain-containing protein 3, mitochondrial isoform X2 [Canis lupus familiaris]
MAAAATSRWLGFRCRLCLKLRGQRASPCGQIPCCRTFIFCRFYSGSATLPKVEGTNITGIEEVVIPRKKTWDKVAVLQALASTVSRDPTAAPYAFQDDPYLIPASSMESRLFLLAKKSGENAAKFIINLHPKYFQKDIAEPHIPCLMPEYFEPQIEDISEAALKERIKLKKVKASVDMFDQLLQAGTTVSLETSNSLLDLLCYYGDREPSTDNHFQQSGKSEELEEDTGENDKKSKKADDQFGVTWRAKNNAERIFALIPEKNSYSYCTMIRGMVKHRALVQALNLYAELLNNRLKADVYTFNALIEATALNMNEKSEDKWNNILELLKQMAAQKVKPNLQTFNTILKCLRRFQAFGRLPALQTFREMKAIGIEPSLATYHHVIQLFYHHENPSKGSSRIIYDIMNEITGQKFTPKDPDDDMFFQSAMRVCSFLRDLELAYQVHGLLNTGDNWKFIGPDHRRNFYYSKFFSLLCLMEQIDVTLKWYKDLVPSVFFPRSQTLIDLLQALDVANRLEVIPQIWKDSKEYGHTFRSDLKEEILMLMARDQHPPELQVAFADCAADIKSTYESQDARQTAPDWPANSLNCIAVLFLRAGRTQEAWKMLGLFRKHNKIPGNKLLNEFMDSAKASNSPAQAIEVVKLAGAFSLPICEGLTQRVMADFAISQEQKEALGNLTSLTSDSDSDSDSDISEGI